MRERLATMCFTADQCCRGAAGKLPARLAGLARGLPVVFVRKSFPAAASTTAATRASATRTRTAAPRCFRTRFVDLEVASAKLFSVKRRNGLGRFIIIRHFDKGKPASTAGLPVHHQMNPRYLPVRLEQLAQLRFRRVKAHVADKKTLHTFS